MCQSSSVSSVSSYQQAALKFQVGIAVAKNAQTATNVQGQAAVELLTSAAQAVKAPGLGGQFDSVG